MSLILVPGPSKLLVGVSEGIIPDDVPRTFRGLRSR